MSVGSSVLCQSTESTGGDDGATGCCVDNVGVRCLKGKREGKLQEVREALGPWARTMCLARVYTSILYILDVHSEPQLGNQ